MADNSDVQVQLNDLEAEEARIMRELREIDEKSRAESAAAGATTSGRPQSDVHVDDPDAALASLLAECEKEVRDAKGYIADHGPPMRIVRLRKGEVGPKTATYLSRPRNTGVDFTVPVEHKSYSQTVKNPIFLNDIRDKIRSRAYTHQDDYISDMRLLYRNTDLFNKGVDLEWVVQHARLLLEAAEEAVKTRSAAFGSIDRAMRLSSSSKHRPPAPASKRKRTSDPSNSDRPSLPSIGAVIEIWWSSPYRRWFPAVIVDRTGSSKAFVRYKSDDSTSWVTLHGSSACNWRFPVSKPPTPTAAPSRPSSRRAEPPPGKKRRAAPSSPRSSAGAPVVIDTVNGDNDALQAAVASQLKDVMSSIKDQFRDGLERVEAMVHRSDGLQRVLLAVQDAQDALQASLGKVTKSIEQLKSNVRSVQREVAELKEVFDSGIRQPRNMRPEPVEYNRGLNELSRRHDRRKERDGYGDTRKERTSGRDYDRDPRRLGTKKGNSDLRNKPSRVDGRRPKDDRGERLDRRSNIKHIERARSDEDPMDVDSITPERREGPRNSDGRVHNEGHLDNSNNRNRRVLEDNDEHFENEERVRLDEDRSRKASDVGSEKELARGKEKETRRREETPHSPKQTHGSRNNNPTLPNEAKNCSDSDEVREERTRDDDAKGGSPMDDNRGDVGNLKDEKKGPTLDDRVDKGLRRVDNNNANDSDSESNRNSDSDESSGNNDGKTRREGRSDRDKMSRPAEKVNSPRHGDTADEALEKYDDKGESKEARDNSDHERDRDLKRGHDPGSDRESSCGRDRDSEREGDHKNNSEGKREARDTRKHDGDIESSPRRDRIRTPEGGEREGDRKEERRIEKEGLLERDEERRVEKTGGRSDHESESSSDQGDSQNEGREERRDPKGRTKNLNGQEVRDDSSDFSGDRDESSSDSDEDNDKEVTTNADVDSGREGKRGSGVGSRPKVSRFAQAPDEDHANNGLDRDQDDRNKVSTAKEADFETDRNESNTPAEDDNGGGTTSGKDSKTNGTTK